MEAILLPPPRDISSGPQVQVLIKTPRVHAKRDADGFERIRRVFKPPLAHFRGPGFNPADSNPNP